MKSRINFLIVLAIGSVMFLGCQDLADEYVDKKPDDLKIIDITFIAKSSTNPVFLSAKVGAEAAAKEISEKYSKIDVKINWRSPKIENAEIQVEKILSAIEDGTDAIMVSSSDDSLLTNAINVAVDSGIDVMTFDSDAPQSKRFAFYGPNNVELGERLMNELAPLIGEKGEIAILGGNQNAPNLQKRVVGVIEELNKYNNISVVGEFYHAENAKEAAAEVLRVNKLYPNLKGWAMVGGWSFFNDTLMDKIDSDKIKIVAVDALPIQLPYIENGVVKVLLGQPTFKWGKICVEKIVDKIYHEKEVEVINEMKLIPVTIENLGGWSRQLRAWGYVGLPDKYLIM